MLAPRVSVLQPGVMDPEVLLFHPGNLNMHPQHLLPYFPWRTPLCHCTSTTVSRYAFACLCPCGLVSDLAKQLVCPTPVAHPFALPTAPQVCCNIMSCCFFPCLALYHGLYGHFTWPYNFFGNHQEEEEEEEEESCCSQGLLNYICVIESEEADTSPSSSEPFLHESLRFAATTLCLSTFCIIPTTCLLRHITTVKYHHTSMQEPLWTTGLVSCFAWPCALVQTMDEINMGNQHDMIFH